MAIEVNAPPLRVAVLAGDALDAVTAVLRGLPEHLPFAVVVACDDPGRVIAGVRATSAHLVDEPAGAVAIAPGRIYVVPSSACTVIDRRLVVDRATRHPDGFDRLLCSVADHVGRDAVAVILRGRGRDGARGLARIKELGGLTIAQLPGDDADSELPRAAIETGCIDLVWSPREIADRLAGLGDPLVRELAAELQRTRDQLRATHAANEELASRMDELLATLSHELRNPLTPLKVALDVMTLMPDDPVQVANSRDIMQRQVIQLSRIVDDLLDLSRVTRGKIQLQRTALDPALVIETALEATRALVVQHRHTVHVHLPAEPLRVLADEARATQVLTKLIANAAIYTRDGGDIRISVERDRDHVLFRVRDNGVGIAPDLLPRIFEMFVHGRDALGRAPGGLGIGLHLVRRLVDLHGGAVTAVSDGEGHGSEFVVALPMAGMR